METRAPFIIVGALVLATIGAVFGFVYWLHNTGGTGARTVHHIQFDGSVSGLLVGAAVLFNGIRVGEVTHLGLAAANPRQVDATIAVTSGTPVHTDTKVGLDFQGLTGVPVIALEGGRTFGASTGTQTLVADPTAGQSMTQAARNALGRVDSVLAENAEPLKSTIANLTIFSEGLARNTSGLDGIVAGLERMTGGGAAPPQKIIYDLTPLQSFVSPKKALKGQVTIPDPTTVVMLETQRILFSPNRDVKGFADVQWADSIPKLLQTKLIQSFENYDIAHAPLRSVDGLDADYQLLIDIRSFQVKGDPDASAVIGFSARILSKNGRLVASRLFLQSSKLDKVDPLSAVAAFNDAFDNIATELITWTADAL
ncbi:phospholipid/cholesterol/gamma-HCH transport system substrate-binding protein [Bradyrhizobium sp. AZCC 1610]|uniref:ABC-type transport auxiliary lipoprotein family protein n=1 Tax=Bradyrhizobium sp. AZCC 1610 TaxID=3117020 RepID=UPI002FF08605